MPLRTRRSTLALMLGAAGAPVLGATMSRAESRAIRPTPRQTAGPFYPDRFPDDVDNDLRRVAGRQGPARGDFLDLSGRVSSLSGRPVEGAVVEIWQVDANGLYLHSGDWSLFRDRDPGFQGYGRATVDASGHYAFRTIRPVAYGSRTPHIHLAVRPRAGETLVTQMYFPDEPANADDSVLNAVRSAADRELLMAVLTPPRNPGLAWAARFDIRLA